MAPKPPPAGKAPAKGPAGPEKPERPPSKLQSCLASYNCATLGIIMLFFLFLFTLWYMSLCAIEKAKRDPLRNAVAQIRQYMISRNAEYGTLNDTDVIMEAEKVARELLPWAEKIKEIQVAIAELHYKLNHNWLAYNGHLYLLTYETQNFNETIKLCNDLKAFIVEIQDDDEEKFLELATKQKIDSYWIGLHYINREWKWAITDVLPQKTYWMKDEPPHYARDKCARLKSRCTTPLACWYTVKCNEEDRGICKQKAESKWMS